MLATPAASFSQEATGSIVVVHPWARSTPPVAKTGAVYLTIQNAGLGADRLVEIQTGVADRAEIHMTETSEGVGRMRQLKSVDVGPGGSAIFSPGKTHVMLIGLKAPLIAGQTFPLVLSFEKAGRIEALVEVSGSSAAPNSHRH